MQPTPSPPTPKDKARLDAYKVRLDRDYKDQLFMGRVFRLMLIEQNSTGGLRLPDGRTCHWRSVPRVASTSLNEIFQEHLAQFWRGASCSMPSRRGGGACAPP